MLANELPQYTGNLEHKIVGLQGAGKGSIVEQIQRTVEDVIGELHKPDSRQQDDPLAAGGCQENCRRLIRTFFRWR
jgi:hypothetical protein